MANPLDEDLTAARNGAQADDLLDLVLAAADVAGGVPMPLFIFLSFSWAACTSSLADLVALRLLPVRAPTHSLIL